MIVYRDIIENIIRIHSELWGIAPTVCRINAGFTNTVFCVAEKYILKLCTDRDNEPEFETEIEFYLKNNGNHYIPRLFASADSHSDSDFPYIILEKIESGTLYDVWHTLSECKRESVVVQICDVMKDIHCVSGKPFDWSAYLKGYCERHFAVLEEQKLLTSNEQKFVIKAIEKFDRYLETCPTKFALIHNDLHFDNIFYNGGDIKVIDYESSRIAPIDKELEIIYFMADMPWKHANKENEKFIREEDYMSLIPYFKKHYPMLFDFPHLEKRIAIYHLRDALEQFGEFPDEKELHDRIKRLARFIIN